MKSYRYAALFVLAALASPAPAATVGITRGDPARTTTPADELRARFDPRLEALRAGQVGQSDSLTEDERAALRAAQDRSAGLLDMRAGDGGALLLIVAVVLLVVLLL